MIRALIIVFAALTAACRNGTPSFGSPGGQAQTSAPSPTSAAPTASAQTASGADLFCAETRGMIQAAIAPGRPVLRVTPEVVSTGDVLAISAEGLRPGASVYFAFGRPRSDTESEWVASAVVDNEGRVPSTTVEVPDLRELATIAAGRINCVTLRVRSIEPPSDRRDIGAAAFLSYAD